MKILYIYRSPRKQLFKEYTQSESPSTFLYGLPELQNFGHQVYFSDSAYKPWNILRVLLQPIELIHQYMLKYPIGFKLHQALLLFRTLRKADVIVTTQDSAGLPILFLKKLHLLQTPIVYISNGLVNALANIQSKKFSAFLRTNLRIANAIVCYSKSEQRTLEQFTGKRVYYIPFGIDVPFYENNHPLPITSDILSVGRDSFRDYETLFAAVSQTNYSVTIVCDRENIKGLRIPNNVTIQHDVSAKKLKKLYQQSKIIVLPLKKNTKPQGQVVLLEAIAMQKPIIASSVPGLTTAFNMKKIPHMTFVKPNDPETLRKQIKQMIQKKSKFSLSQSVRNYISMDRYSRDLEQIMKKMYRL